MKMEAEEKMVLAGILRRDRERERERERRAGGLYAKEGYACNF